jgi:hypothetical protein
VKYTEKHRERRSIDSKEPKNHTSDHGAAIMPKTEADFPLKPSGFQNSLCSREGWISAQ